MFIGHFAVALGAKRIAPAVSLGTLFLACQLADLVWPSLVLLGIESVAIDPGNTMLTPLDFRYYPFSHSLLMLGLWAAVFAALYSVLVRVDRKVIAVIIGLVLSHWLLDVLTHRPDMPLVPGNGVRLGLGLWNAPAAAIVAELSLFALGTWLYMRSTTAIDRKGRIGFWALIAFLLLVNVANVLAGISGSPPPSANAVAWSAQAIWLLVAWGYWVDSHRVANRPLK